MKSIIILSAIDNVEYGFKKVFSNQSAFDLTLAFSNELCNFLENSNHDEKTELVILHTKSNKSLILEQVECFKTTYNFNSKIHFIEKEFWTNEIFFTEISVVAQKLNSKTVIFSSAFCPFINFDLTKKLIQTHTTFQSEYCFADGFPNGVSPEILDSGLCKILAELIKTKDQLKNLYVTDSSIFDLMKTDINSFEIETEISDIDWRMYRFNFSCTKNENFIACKNLFDKIQTLKSDNKFSENDQNDIQKIIEIAAKEVSVLKPVPAFFNIQLCSKNLSDNPFSAFTKFKAQNNSAQFFNDDMDFEKLCILLKQINELNPEAVISFSLWGNPLLHKDFFDCCKEVLKYDEFSLFIETDGFDFLTQDVNFESDFYKNLVELSKIVQSKKMHKNGFNPIMFAVNIDAMTQETFDKIHPNQKLSNALKSLEILSDLFGQNVYAQFLRLEQNEEELESFFRTFKEKDSISKGQLIIQKYDDFCKNLPNYKPADLSPLERFPCWHLRRDFCILSNGDVPVCKAFSFEKINYNVFNNSISEIVKSYNDELQNHIDNKYCKGCSACDEYYTYNF